MKIAIIGSGISGLTCAHLLAPQHDIELFEANNYLGGHTATIDVETLSGKYAIDTGFIVFNDWTYPNFIKLLSKLGVASAPTSMGFSVKSEPDGLEYNGTTLNSLFAQRRNLLRPSFYRMLKDIIRFNKESLRVLSPEGAGDGNLSLGEYLLKHGYSREFREHYIVPMGGAIWSSTNEQVEGFPIKFFVQFFKNHGLLSVNDRPVWRVIQNGSRSYIKPLIQNFREKIRLNSPVLKVSRYSDHVKLEIKTPEGLRTEIFDHVIFATHSDQTMKILQNPTMDETLIFEGFRYQANSVLLHTDTSVLPKRKLAWAAWNYLITKEKQHHVSVTYDMNILQRIKSPETFCVSLNMDHHIDPALVLGRYTYDHPVYTPGTVSSQARWGEISGKNRTHFSGAYWGYGFHEDGVKSALRVCEAFGVSL